MEQERLDLHTGESHTISLAGMLSAGYAWTFAIEGDEGVAEVVPYTPEIEPATTMPGASVDEVFILKATGPGKTLVRFTQRRPWETDVPATNERVIELSVT